MATSSDRFKPDPLKMAAITAEYGDPLDDLSWVSASRARDAETERAGILTALGDRLVLEFKQTKPHLGPLSPGCRICGQGGWSCLFVNGKCNCRCFYCPTTQDEIGVPTTNRVPFEKAGHYADYVHHFDFSGVSISGGEPLLTFERTLSHIQAVRRKMGDRLHIWLYTNATLLTREHLFRLRDVGLNEIRMDISAADYGLKKAAMAVGTIPCVTVEIPAVPEDRERLAGLLPVMQDLGINHLNLHQLRLTPHNRANFRNRPYTYLHGEKVTVLESELTALVLLETACARGLELPINYCSFVYKHRFQSAAARRRNARMVLKDHESITENGYIRTLVLQGPWDRLRAVVQHLDDLDTERRLWQLNAQKDRLSFHARLWPLIDRQGCNLMVGYSEAGLSPHISYRCYFKEVRINPDKRLYVEKRPVTRETRLDVEHQKWFGVHLLGEQIQDRQAAIAPELQEIVGFELIQPGLQIYF